MRQLCAACCAALALLMIAVGAPLMDDLGLFAVIAASCYFAAGWVARGGPRIAFAAVPGAVTVNARAVAGRPIYDRHRAQPRECRRSHVGISCYRAYCAAAGPVVEVAVRTSILACGRSRGKGLTRRSERSYGLTELVPATDRDTCGGRGWSGDSARAMPSSRRWVIPQRSEEHAFVGARRTPNSVEDIAPSV
jgi:hypothetical protein